MAEIIIHGFIEKNSSLYNLVNKIMSLVNLEKEDNSKDYKRITIEIKEDNG